MKVLAGKLPESRYTIVRVPLRSVEANRLSSKPIYPLHNSTATYSTLMLAEKSRNAVDGHYGQGDSATQHETSFEDWRSPHSACSTADDKVSPKHN
jgi:hypothetical protein